jgi:hypothetical protein
MGTSATPNVTGLPPTFKRAARIWWAWIWRSVLLGLGGSVFVSLVVGISGILNRTSEEVSRVIAMVMAVIVSVPLGIWAFQMVLEKNFREFTIRLVPRMQEGETLKSSETHDPSDVHADTNSEEQRARRDYPGKQA